jgi:hyaluronan-mediated motility receptor
LLSFTRLAREKRQIKQSLEELEERYRPFQDQIDGLEGINLLLQNQTSMAQSEAQRLSEQYSRLLGHQNQKQKIQHVKKLKDENAGLKQVR